MKITVHHRPPEPDTYRAARVRSLFNADSAAVDIEADLPIEDRAWSLGVVVGPSGSGKSTIGRAIWGPRAVYRPTRWPKDAPIVEAIAPEQPFDAVTAALAAVGLGTVPAWLRPYRLLSTGERFRADLARIVCEAPPRIVIDEFSSVVDRQIARIGAMAFAKAWRRRAREASAAQAVLLSCHYDILDWLQPDWVWDTATGRFAGRWLRRRPPITLDITETDWRYWPLFEPHHYLKVPRMVTASCYVGWVDEAPVAHIAFSTRPGLVEARACRLVVMPEWQGAGVGVRFLNTVCEAWWHGHNRYGIRVPSLYLWPQDKVLRYQGGTAHSYELYEDLLQDDRIYATFAQRRSAVVARDWAVEPGGTKRRDKMAADFIRETLEHVRWDTVTDRMLYGVYYGFSVVECMWARDGRRVALDAVKVRNRRRFVFDPDFRLLLLTNDQANGESMPDRKFWHFAAGADNDDEPYGRGLAYWLYWPWWFKRNHVRFWMTFLEKFGIPTGVGKYPKSAGPRERAVLLDAVRAIHSDSAVTVPEDMVIELLEASRGGSANYDSFYLRMDEAITTVVLSQTMTTGDGSSQAQAKVHMEVRREVCGVRCASGGRQFQPGACGVADRVELPRRDAAAGATHHGRSGRAQSARGA